MRKTDTTVYVANQMPSARTLATSKCCTIALHRSSLYLTDAQTGQMGHVKSMDLISMRWIMCKERPQRPTQMVWWHVYACHGAYLCWL